MHDWQKTYWQDEQGNRTTIQDILLDLQDEPIVTLKIEDLAHVPSVTIDQHRKERTDLTVPIIVEEKDGRFKSILDGHHRRQKAIDQNVDRIPAKVFRGDIFKQSKLPASPSALDVKEIYTREGNIERDSKDRETPVYTPSSI